MHSINTVSCPTYYRNLENIVLDAFLTNSPLLEIQNLQWFHSKRVMPIFYDDARNKSSLELPANGSIDF